MFDLFDGFLDLLGIGDADDDPADGADMLGGGASAQGVDLDGDGVPDIMMYQQEVDLDGDGIPDGMMYQQEVDLDGDGIPDGFMIQQDLDTDGDGQIDTTIYQQQLDTDGDGYVDTIQTETLVDLDGDMIADQYSMKVEQDTDGDGYMDYMTLQEDYDGDGIMDLEGEFADLDGDGFYEALDGGADSMLPGYDQNYDPALSDPGQGGGRSCGGHGGLAYAGDQHKLCGSVSGVCAGERHRQGVRRGGSPGLRGGDGLVYAGRRNRHL